MPTHKPSVADKWEDVHSLPLSHWRETAADEGALFMEVVKQLVHNDDIGDAALRAAASSVLAVLPILQAFKKNVEVLERLAEDALGLIVAIWRSYDTAVDPKHWPPVAIQQTIDKLAGTLQVLYTLVKRKAEKNCIKRTIYSIVVVGDTKRCRRKMKSTVAKLEAEHDIDINSLLLEVVQEQETWYRHQVQPWKSQVAEHDANAAKREAEKMLEEERKKYAKDEWRNFTVLMHAK